ncbi:endonuclease III [Thiovulum sp. ES]|nr:endonuclease III [Thiovulum sp. ES]
MLIDFERVEKIKKTLLEKYPHNIAKSELNFQNNFQLIVAVVLSAQCTDKRVNLITPQLFQKFPTPQKMAKADFSEVRSLISSCNLFQNKSKYLINLSNQLLENFSGEVPLNQKDLMSLSGVGQKTANVVLIEGGGANLMAVDTHVFRVSHRLELSSAKTPEKTESDLSELFRTDLGQLHQAFVLFGRYICKAREPDCGNCFFSDLCNFRKNDLIK